MVYAILLTHLVFDHDLVHVPPVFFLAMLLVYLRDMMQTRKKESH